MFDPPLEKVLETLMDFSLIEQQKSIVAINIQIIFGVDIALINIVLIEWILIQIQPPLHFFFSVRITDLNPQIY
jgi:hypothetical protein